MDYRQKIIEKLKHQPLPRVQDFKHDRTAAVLVPIIEKDKDEPHVVLTRRADHLKSHAGQVSFPGGHWEKTDKDLIQTALREAQEEIGLDPALVKTVGVLPTHLSGGGQPMVPIVGLVEAHAPFQINADEVADLFTAPLSFLMNFNNYEERKVHWEGKDWVYHSTHWEGFKIWGATANILRSFSDKVFP